MSREIYLDNNATTKPHPEVRDAMLSALNDRFGNPSSNHSAGERARDSLRSARKAVATLLGAEHSQVFFTSGATESNNIVLGFALRRVRTGGRPHIVTSNVEHSSIKHVLNHLRLTDVDITTLQVDSCGHLDLDGLAQAISKSTFLVSIQWANNETGVIQPIGEIADLCRERGILFHTDAAQAMGKVPMELAQLPIDFLSCTAHKLHGPTGVGALYVRERNSIEPLFFGGPQETSLRPGTENVPGIVGFGVAAHLRHCRLTQTRQHCRFLRDRFELRVIESVPDVTVNGDSIARLDNTTNLCFAGVDGQALVARLDQHGILCSQSSACTNQRPEPSYVLRAMGLSEDDAYSSVRFSVSEQNTIEDVDHAADVVIRLCNEQRAFRARMRVSPSNTVEVV